LIKKRFKSLFIILPLFIPISSSAKSPSIRKVIIKRNSVFNTDLEKENKFIFRFANKVHFKTKEAVIKRELLFKENELYDEELIKESERNLRAFNFIKAVVISSVPIDANQVDIVVETIDSWTTNPQAGFGKRADEVYYFAGFEELNFGGRGKNISVFYSRLGDKTQREIRYADPQFFGKKIHTVGLFSKVDDNEQLGFDILSPFYTFRTPYSGSVSVIRQRIEKEYFTGEEGLFDFYQRQRFFRVQVGKKIKEERRMVERVNFGFEFREDKFDIPVNHLARGFFDRKLVGLDAGFSLEEKDYIKVFNVYKMHRIEDINLGRGFYFSIGLAPEFLGSTKNYLYFNTFSRNGFRSLMNSFGLIGIGVEGRRSNRSENLITYGNVNYIIPFHARWSQAIVAHSEIAYGQNLDAENFLTLGGKSGLRGFKIDAFTGNHSMLTNIEYRAVHPRELFNLIHLGGAAFFDIGGVGSNWHSTINSTRSDIGIGLRIIPSRSSSGAPWRLDVARQISAGSNKKGWVISLFGGHAFDLFNNSIKKAKKKPLDYLRETDPDTRHSEK